MTESTNGSPRPRTISHRAHAALTSILATGLASSADLAQTTTILPIGDSRVQGLRPEFESYRYGLWRELTCIGAQFDLVGPLQDEAAYPPFLGQTFDPDHAGVGGWTTYDVLEFLPVILEDNPQPDVVLLGIGGNDILDGFDVPPGLDNIERIIAGLRASHPGVAIVIEQIAPGESEFMTPDRTAGFAELNAGIAAIGAALSTPASPVLVVDMDAGWQDAWLADVVHYNEAGGDIVGKRYVSALRRLQIRGLTPNPPCGVDASVCDRDADGGFDVFDVLTYIEGWAQAVGNAVEPGNSLDLDGDRVVGVGDLLGLLACE